MLKKGTAVCFCFETQCLHDEITICSKARKQKEECTHYLDIRHLDIMVMKTAFMQEIYIQCLSIYVTFMRTKTVTHVTYVKSGMKVTEQEIRNKV